MCGIVGIFGHPEASTLAYLALYALQHRGQESAGIVTAGNTAEAAALLAFLSSPEAMAIFTAHGFEVLP